MENLLMNGVKQVVRKEAEPFFREIIDEYENLHSIHLVGSAITEDFAPGVSDINSVLFLKQIDLEYLDQIAVLGKKYHKKRISAPLVITPEYLQRSLDSFPIEFLNFKLIHHTVYGPDIFSGVEIGKSDLRIQCEREIKSKLLLLRQSYISSMGDRKQLLENISRSLSGFLPLFRGMLFLLGKEVPVHASEVVRAVEGSFNLRTAVFERVLNVRYLRHKPSKAEIPALFEEYYGASERISGIIDDLKI